MLLRAVPVRYESLPIGHDFGGAHLNYDTSHGAEPRCNSEGGGMSGRFTLHGSPHSLPTYRVALMMRLGRAGFTFRYVSFQLGMHLTPEFRALSRWGQVPVLEHG